MSKREIHRHAMPDEVGGLSFGDEALIEAVSAHFTARFGAAAHVFHEMMSPHVHVDVHLIEPTPERMYWVLYTTGMAELPMHLPEEAASAGLPLRAELMMKVEPTWDFAVGEELAGEERHARDWPIQWLRILARLPHMYRTWLWDGHTIPNGERKPSPFAPGTDHCCWLLLHESGDHVTEDFGRLATQEHGEIGILLTVPINADETDCKLRSGTEVLLPALRSVPGWDVVHMQRPSAVTPRKRRKLFGLF